MYEPYTHQSLPPKEYRELLGTALCVFNSNNGFIIENILRLDDSYDWYKLVDKTSGYLKKDIENTITQKTGNTEIYLLFEEIVDMRDRIVHSFRITNINNEQALATKTKIKDGNNQLEITEKYLIDFIKKNDELSNLLHRFRGY